MSVLMASSSAAAADSAESSAAADGSYRVGLAPSMLGGDYVNDNSTSDLMLVTTAGERQSSWDLSARFRGSANGGKGGWDTWPGLSAEQAQPTDRAVPARGGQS